MNIFYVSSDPHLAAKYQCDKHVVKMILESAQMLSTAHWILDINPIISNLYKPTHKNHPSAVWVRENSQNYLWLYIHFVSLCDEYRYRYGKTHLTESKLLTNLEVLPKNIKMLPHTKCEEPPLCMPDEFKSDDVVTSYRNYYTSKQNSFKMVWTKRNPPEWFKYKENK